MREQSTRGQESTRPEPGSSGRRANPSPSTAGEGAAEGARLVGQMASVSGEMMTVWADVNQRVMHDVLELAARTTQEGMRQLAEWQQMQVEMLREMQTATLRWTTIWPEVLRDPVRGYQQALETSIETAQRASGLMRRQTETLTEGCQRFERAAGDATRTLGATVREATSRVQAAYSEHLHAA
jgi:hypothetical protein